VTVGQQIDTEAPAAYLDRYGRMLLIRRFETEMQRLFLKGEVHGTTHLCAGQEAVPVGVCSALEPDDYLAGTYRGHGHALAKGTDPDALLAEMLGRATGVCGGRAGSMNVIDVDHGLVGCFGSSGAASRRRPERRSRPSARAGWRWPCSATGRPTRATSTSA